MDQAEVEAFLTGLENVQQTENYGYLFYFVGDDHRLPFVTIANTDSDYDNVSNLDREGVFRVNIGLSKDSFTNLVGEADPESVDYTELNVFLPHPDYHRQNFICILNPSNENTAVTKQLILEAHAIATARFQRKEKD